MTAKLKQQSTEVSKPIRVIVVDDEPIVRTGIRKLLAEEKDVTLVAECPDGKAAIEAIKKKSPDIVFLDVQMPEVDGFHVIKSLNPKKLPIIIFITAYDRYAVKAFELHALDYLLKPFGDERFKQALERARSSLGLKNQVDLNSRMFKMLESLRENQETLEEATQLLKGQKETAYLNHIAIKSSGKISIIKIEEIHWIESADNYVRIHVHGGVHLLREKISDLERSLDPTKFVRIHRSAIVNIDRIKELKPLFHGDYLVVLHDATQLNLSRNYRDRLSKVLNRVF